MIARTACALVLIPPGWTGILDAQQQGLRAGERVRETSDAFPGAGPLDADGKETMWCVRIVDALDRRPIAGALVQVPWHPNEPVVEAEVHHQCIGVADEDGWARLPLDAVRGYREYVFADASGYVADEHCYPDQLECALQRGVDVPVEVLDYTGRPVPGARIELVLGCGHVPSQRSVIADEHGRATLPDIDPSRHEDFFVWAPGCQYGAYQLHRTWRPGSPPVPIDVAPGITVEGRVVDAAGNPVAGVALGGRTSQRWTRTGPGGRFRLVGLAAWHDIVVHAPRQLGIDDSTRTAPPAGVAWTIVLGAPTDGCRLGVHAVGAGGEPAVGVRIVAVRDADGATYTGISEEPGTVTLNVPPGHYRVMADGELGAWGKSAGGIDMVKGTPASMTLTVPRNPTVHVDASQVRDLAVGIATADCFLRLDPAEIDGKDLPVPTDRRATFRISTQEADAVRFVDVPAPGSKVVLQGPPEARLRAHFVGPDGKPTSAKLSVGAEYFGGDEAATELSVTTRLLGLVTWYARPDDDSLGPARGDATLSAGGEVDVGPIRFAKARKGDLHVELPSAMTAEERPPRVAMETFSGAPLDEHDSIWIDLTDPTHSEWVAMKADGWVPFRFRLAGEPPWNVKWPTASLHVALRSVADKRIGDAVAILDGTPVKDAWKDGKEILLRGLTAGAHTLVLAERHHLAKVFDLVITDGEDRTLAVELTPRDE